MAFDFLNLILCGQQTATTDDDTFTGSTITRGLAQSMAIIFNPVAIDIALTALKLQGSDDDSTWDDISPGSFAAAQGGYPIKLPGANDDGKGWFWLIPYANYKYYRVTGTVGNGSTGCQWVLTYLGFAPREGPKTDADRGGVPDSVRFLTAEA